MRQFGISVSVGGCVSNLGRSTCSRLTPAEVARVVRPTRGMNVPRRISDIERHDLRGKIQRALTRSPGPTIP